MLKQPHFSLPSYGVTIWKVNLTLQARAMLIALTSSTIKCSVVWCWYLYLMQLPCWILFFGIAHTLQLQLQSRHLADAFIQSDLHRLILTLYLYMFFYVGKIDFKLWFEINLTKFQASEYFWVWVVFFVLFFQCPVLRSLMSDSVRADSNVLLKWLPGTCEGCLSTNKWISISFL